MEYAVCEGELEIRQFKGAKIVAGIFRYDRAGIIRDRGGVRKERFARGAFRYAIDDADQKLDFLSGHDFGKPIASRRAGTLDIVDNGSDVTFQATLPTDPPTWVVDAEKAIAAGIMTGLSPGFRIPPPNVVPNAEEIVPEPGNPGVFIRQINHAVLREMSLVTNPVYDDTGVELRAEDSKVLFTARSVYQWL